MNTKKIGDVQPGDILIGVNGEPVTVTDTYDPHVPEKMFEIELSDGSLIKASGNHLWYIVTDLDVDLYRERIKSSKKELEGLSRPALETLINVALSDEEVETSLIDMIQLVSAGDNKKLTQVIVRIAESMGHIAETKMDYQDITTGELIENQDGFRTYDARVFAQQVLALTGIKEYKKKWKIIQGRVVTTEQLLLLGEDIDIPILKEHLS